MSSLSYFNKIDDFIDHILDDFGSYILNSEHYHSKKIKTIIKEINFIKYQKELNDILISYTESLPIDKIKDIIRKENSISLIMNVIKRYICVYLFLLIALHFFAKDDIYINNILEFVKNQPEYNFRVSDFFNSKSNALLIECYHIVKNIQAILKGNLQIPVLKKQLFGVETHEIFTQMSPFWGKADQSEAAYKSDHVIIKTVIALRLYNQTDKIALAKLLETIELSEEEYIFIEILETVSQMIDISILENLIKKKSLLYPVWDYITNPTKFVDLNDDEKILALCTTRHKLMIPIVDDFMLYHKDSENYFTMAGSHHSKFQQNLKNPGSTHQKRTENTKIKYIVDKIDAIAERKPTATFYGPESHRNAITINDSEDIKIINKFIKQSQFTPEEYEYIHEFIRYKSYPYISFRHDKTCGDTCRHYSLYIPPSIKTINLVRYVNFEKLKLNKNNYMQIRSSFTSFPISIIGYYLTNREQDLHCIKVHTIPNEKIILFNKPIDPNNPDDTEKQKLVQFYNTAIKKISDKIIRKLLKFNSDNHTKITLKAAYSKINYYACKYIPTYYSPLTNYSSVYIAPYLSYLETNYNELYALYHHFEYHIYQSMNEKIRDHNNFIFDDNENKMYGIYDGTIISLPKATTSSHTPQKQNLIKFDLKQINDQLITAVNNKKSNIAAAGGICQHNITWENIVTLRNNHHTKYSEELFEFNKQYIIETNEQGYICKSCGFSMDIQKYVIGGSFDEELKQFISYGIVLIDDFMMDKQYAQFKQAIQILDKLIEKLASIINISHLIGSSVASKNKRKFIIKQTIDMLLANNKLLVLSRSKEEGQQRSKHKSQQHTNRQDSSFFIFELDNNVLQFSSKDKDLYRNIKINNIIAYLIVFMILDLSDVQIYFLSTDKNLCNYDKFEDLYELLFTQNLQIKKNKSDMYEIRECKTFCYLLYMMSCRIIKYNLWKIIITAASSQQQDHKQNLSAKTPTKKRNSKKKLSRVTTTSRHRQKKLSRITTSHRRQKKLSRITTTSRHRNKRLSNHQKINQQSITTQKNIINTIIDVINSVLENSYLTATATATATTSGNQDHDNAAGIQNSNAYMFEMFRSRFYDKFYNLFCSGDGNLMNKEAASMQQHMHNLLVLENITAITTFTKHESIDDKLLFTPKNYQNRKSLLSYYDHTYLLPRLAKKLSYKINNINSLTNCPTTGNFHVFYVQGKWEPSEFKCMLCNTVLRYQEDAAAEHKNIKIQEKYIEHIVIPELCPIENKAISYTACKETRKNASQQEYNRFLNIKKQELPESRPPVSDTTIKDLIHFMIKIYDHDTINHTNLLHNAYTIDHDYLGNKLATPPIHIKESDKKVQFKENHPYFKRDIYYFTTYAVMAKITMFYNAASASTDYIGYKEESKDYVLTANAATHRQLQINYSLQNKLKILESMDLENIKRLIYYFEIILNRIRNKYPWKKEDHALMFFESQLYYLIEKYGNLDKTQVQEAAASPLLIKKQDKQIIFNNFMHLLYTYASTEQKQKLMIEFIVEYINIIFNTLKFRETKYELLRYTYVLQSSSFARDIADKTYTPPTDKAYNEPLSDEEEKTEIDKKIKRKEIYDSEEAASALDISVEKGDEYNGEDDTALDYEEIQKQSDDWTFPYIGDFSGPPPF